MSVSAQAAKLEREAKWVKGARIASIALVLVVGVVEVIDAVGPWVPPDWLVYGGRTLILVVTATEGTWGLVRKTRWDNYETLKSQLDKTLTAAVVSVSKETGIEVDALGVSIWAVETHKAAPPSLIRQGSLRLSGYPPPSSVTWTAGKGVIGLCWSEDRVVYAPMKDLQPKYPPEKSVSNGQWSREKAKWGFSQDEYVRQIWKYSQILAVPFGDGTGFKGCLSLDIATEREPGVSIDTTEVREILGQNGVLVYAMLVERGTL